MCQTNSEKWQTKTEGAKTLACILISYFEFCFVNITVWQNSIMVWPTIFKKWLHQALHCSSYSTLVTRYLWIHRYWTLFWFIKYIYILDSTNHVSSKFIENRLCTCGVKLYPITIIIFCAYFCLHTTFLLHVMLLFSWKWRMTIVMYIDDEQSVRTPMTFVPPRPPPWRTPRHSSVQRDGMFAG